LSLEESRQYGGLECCRVVVDPLTLISVIGGIAGVTYILRQAVINKITAGRKKRSVSWCSLESLGSVLTSGELVCRSLVET